ncbi:TPA: hypothetical protein KEY88_005296 [Serratia marcescens]|uniref:Uncharacterized protein n=1 Tax=Serratia ureilytica TaxID=300181 RepID=A0A9X9G0P8_9GAMM|nr:hypothetical protein [Serratia ureilytica]TXE24485.1 hypothetical protein FOT63_23730 [Serratia ureilytica]HBC7422523.1 hypothetical protein [Serratia marcescens]
MCQTPQITPYQTDDTNANFDAFRMPAYHESISVTPIPPLEVSEATVEFVTTGQAAESKSSAQSECDEAEIMAISREELDAKLLQNKAEINAVASEVRRDMAEWREQNSNQISQLTVAINALSAKVDGKFEGIQGQFEGIQGQIAGLNTAINGIQSGISTRLAIFGVIIAVVVAIPSLISAYKDNPAPQPQSQQPIIIQVPQQPPQSNK